MNSMKSSVNPAGDKTVSTFVELMLVDAEPVRKSYTVERCGCFLVSG